MKERWTQKQEDFCLKYVETGKAGQAAIDAGYSPKTAEAIASHNLIKPIVKARIEELRKMAVDASIASIIERKQKLTEITRANIPDFVEDSGIKVEKKSPNVGAVSEVTTKTKVYRKGGEPVNITTLKLHNPIQAIAELNKMEHIYEPGDGVVVDNRTINIFVYSEKAKDLTERLIAGEGTGGHQDH